MSSLQLAICHNGGNSKILCYFIAFIANISASNIAYYYNLKWHVMKALRLISFNILSIKNKARTLRATWLI